MFQDTLVSVVRSFQLIIAAILFISRVPVVIVAAIIVIISTFLAIFVILIVIAIAIFGSFAS